MKKQSRILFILIALIVFGIIYLIISLTQNVGKTDSTITMEKSVKNLQALYKNIDVKKANIQRSGSLEDNEQATILPDISEYPFIVNPTTDDFITIYASTEIANESNNSCGSSTDSFFLFATLRPLSLIITNSSKIQR